MAAKTTRKTAGKITADTNSIYLSYPVDKPTVVFVRLETSTYKPLEKWVKLQRYFENYALMGTYSTQQVNKYIDDFIYALSLEKKSAKISYLKSSPLVKIYQKK